MFSGLLWAGWVVGNILSVIQGMDRQQQDVNTKRISALLEYVEPPAWRVVSWVCFLFLVVSAILRFHVRDGLTDRRFFFFCFPSKYGANFPRAFAVKLMHWAESSVTTTVEDVLADLPAEIRTDATMRVYK